MSFDKFQVNRARDFETMEEMKAGYERLCKAEQGILLTRDEFEKEAIFPTAEGVYDALCGLASKKRLTALDVYQYARFGWCRNNPAAIIAYQTDTPYNNPRSWRVNTCAEKITVEAAQMTICREFGFETSRIVIIETPYYGTTDSNFIRFDCACWSWLMHDGDISSVLQ